METNKSPTRFKCIQRLAALVTALAMAFVSAGSAHAAFLFQDDAFHLIPSEGIFLNSDGAAGTTAKLDVDGSGNLTIDADGDIDTQDNFTVSNAIFTVDGTGTVDFSAADQVRIREVAFAAYTGAGTAPTCTSVGEIALDTNTDAIFVCTDATTDTWKSADNNPAAGTAAGNFLYWNGTAWVETGAITTDGTDVNVTGDLDTDGVIVAGTGDTQITNATGDLQQTYNFTNDNVLTDNDSVYSALDKLDTEFGLIDFEYVYGNDADQTLTASTTFDIDATGAVGIDSDAGVTVGGAGISLTSDGGALALTGDGTNDIDVSNAGAAIDVDSATFTLDTTGAFSIDGVGASNVTTDSGNLTLSTTTSGNVNVTSVADITFTDQYDSLTFGQASLGLGGDLLNTAGEIFSSTGTIGSTIGAGGETSTSLIHAINAVGTYAVSVGAGALDDLDDVYNNGPVIATLDNGDTGYNITSADSYVIQDGGTTVFEISGAGDVNFDPTSGQNFNVTTLGAGDFVVTSADDVDINSATVNIDTTGAGSLDFGAASNVTTSAGDLTLSATTNSVVVTGAEAAADAVTITASNAAGGVDINAGTGGITMDSTGAISIDAAGASNVTTSSGNLTLSATNGQIVFDDLQLTGTVQMSVADADWAIALPSDGIVDNINAFTSTANGEGASLVGIEDVGGYFTATDVEGALQELGTVAGQKVETLRFYPEYPDAVYDPSTYRGALEAIYDASEGNAYKWTTTQNADQTMIIRKRFELPADFADVNDLTLRYKTLTGTADDNTVALSLYNVTNANTLCGSFAATANNAWSTMTLGEATIKTGCTGITALDAGDIVEIRVTLLTNKNGTANAGYVLLGYDK